MVNLRNKNTTTKEYVFKFEIGRKLKSNLTLKWDSQKYSKHKTMNLPKQAHKDSSIFASHESLMRNLEQTKVHSHEMRL